MKVTDASTYRVLQTNLGRNATKMQDLFLQGSTGLKLNKASDNPSAIQPVLTARNQITLNERFLNTLEISSDKMAATDTNLATVENIFQRVKEISVNAINSSLNQQDLDTFADEVNEVKKQMLDSANAQLDGKYIFAGYSVDNEPFIENVNYDPELYDQADRTTWPVLYVGDNNRTTLEIGENEFLDVNLTGNELFLGIENNEWETGYPGLTGSAILSSGPLTPGAAGDITIQNDNTTYTIPASFLTDNGDNYANVLGNLLESGPCNLSDMSSLAGYSNADGDTYSLTIDSNSTPINVTLDGSPGQEFTLAGIASTLGNQLVPPDPAATSGTLPNGVNFDTTTGELLLTHSDPSATFTLSENIVDGDPANGTPLTGITDSIIHNADFSTTSVGLAVDDVGDLSQLATFNALASDQYQLDITSTSGTINVVLDGNPGQELTPAGMQSALGNQLVPPDAAATSGTLPNGVSYDLSSGNLIFKGPVDGGSLDLSESVTDGDLLDGAAPTAILGGTGSRVTAGSSVTTVTAAADSELTDSLINATINPATTDLGDFNQLASYNPLVGDQYQLDITTEGNTVSVTLDGSAGQELTLAGLTTALGNSLVPAAPTAISGTLPNGVRYDLSTGSLILSGNDNGADIDLTETVTDGDLLDGPAPDAVFGGTSTAYGTVDVTADTTENTTISGAGLANAGLTAGTLTGSVTVDIFGILTRLEESLRAGNINDEDGVGGGVQENLELLDLAADQNRRKRSQLGVKAMRVEDSISGLESSIVDTKMILSRYQDADITETYNAIIQQQTAWEAALSVTGKVSEISILDYL